MNRADIVLYTDKDSDAAIRLEEQLSQGGKLSLMFRRPTFHARSRVYEKSIILCAKDGDRLVGVAAGAKKKILVRGEQISALYGYDLRVHPDYRGFGTARRLAQAVIDHLESADCIYTLVAGQNERAVRFTRCSFGPTSIIRLTYLILPVFRRRSSPGGIANTGLRTVYDAFLRETSPVTMVPEFHPELHAGHVSSHMLTSGRGGCSIWTNESMLAETVAELPVSLRLARYLTAPLSRLHLAPHVPTRGETLKSWFLYNLFAKTPGDVRAILAAINNLALERKKDYLYLLVQEDDPLITRVRDAGFRFLTVPYLFFAKGEKVPSAADRLFIDIRDL